MSTAADIDITPLVSADRLLIALDFDGVLAPLQDDPETSRMLDGSAAAIEALTKTPGTQVALVSGRDAATLRRLAAPPPGTWLIGSHGAEADFSGGVDRPEPDALDPVHPELTETESSLLDSIDAYFDQLTAHDPEHTGPTVRIEKKPYSRTVHTRGLDPEFVSTIRARLPHVGSRFPELRIIKGHDIVEYSVKDATKGDGMGMLIGACHPDAVTYLGDDVTDEDAFRELEKHPRAVSIKVGLSPTRADWRIHDPLAVSRFLERLLLERGLRLSGDDLSADTVAQRSPGGSDPG